MKDGSPGDGSVMDFYKQTITPDSVTLQICTSPFSSTMVTVSFAKADIENKKINNENIKTYLIFIAIIFLYIC